MSDPGRPDMALDAPGIRRELRRRRARALLVLFAGLVGLLLALISAGHAEQRADRLERDGVRTDGTITGLHPGRYLAPRAVTVSFRIDGDERTVRVGLTDVSPRYQVGDPVAVLFDPNDPERATIDGETNATPLEVRTFLLGFVLGSAAVISGAALLLFHRNTRRILRTGPWRPAIVAFARFNHGYLQVGLSVTGERERHKELASAVKHRHRDVGKLLATPQPLEAVGDVDGRVLIRIEDRPQLLVLREPRMKRLRRFPRA